MPDLTCPALPLQIDAQLAGNKSAAYFAKPHCIRWAPKSVPKPTKR